MAPRAAAMHTAAAICAPVPMHAAAGTPMCAPADMRTAALVQTTTTTLAPLLPFSVLRCCVCAAENLHLMNNADVLFEVYGRYGPDGF